MTLGSDSNSFAHRTNWDLRPTPLSLARDQARADGRKILDLTCTNPTRCGFENPAFVSPPSGTDGAYQPDAQGLLSAREAVARYYADMGERVDPERIVLTASTSEAYSFLFRLLANPNDRVAVPAPSYPLLDYLADLSDVELVRYPLHYDDRWWVDIDALKSLCRTRLRGIVSISPNNPTGSVLTPTEHDAIVTLAAENGTALIADEVFLDYGLNAQPASSVGETRALTFTLSGVSKILAMPQMKLSWIVVSGPEADVAQATERLRIIGDTFLSVAAPVQHALPDWLANRHAIQQAIRERLAVNVLALQNAFGTDALHVCGGWAAVIRVPDMVSSETFCWSLLDAQGVLADPGHLYGFPDAGSLVLSLLTPPAQFATGIGAIRDAIDGLLSTLGGAV